MTLTIFLARLYVLRIWDIWRHIKSVNWKIDLIVHLFIENHVVRLEAVETENENRS